MIARLLLNSVGAAVSRCVFNLSFGKEENVWHNVLSGLLIPTLESGKNASQYHEVAYKLVHSWILRKEKTLQFSRMTFKNKV